MTYEEIIKIIQLAWDLLKKYLLKPLKLQTKKVIPVISSLFLILIGLIYCYFFCCERIVDLTTLQHGKFEVGEFFQSNVDVDLYMRSLNKCFIF